MQSMSVYIGLYMHWRRFPGSVVQAYYFRLGRDHVGDVLMAVTISGIPPVNPNEVGFSNKTFSEGYIYLEFILINITQHPRRSYVETFRVR